MKEFNTPYDDVYRTMLQECRTLIIPVINEIFKTDYTGKETINMEENEIFMFRQEKTDKRITDSSFSIESKSKKKYYHLECQSTINGNMAVRMYEYDSQIALKHKDVVDNVLNVKFPYSAILYLRHNKNTPDVIKINIETPGGKVIYDIKTLKIKHYSIEEIFDKHLFFLIPFYFFVFEDSLLEIENNETKLIQLKKEYSNIMKRLEELNNNGIIDVYEMVSIRDMTRKVVESLAENYENVKKGVVSVMGGKVLDYEAKRIKDETRAEAILECIELLKELDISEEVIKEKIMQRFKLSKTDAEVYINNQI